MSPARPADERDLSGRVPRPLGRAGGNKERRRGAFLALDFPEPIVNTDFEVDGAHHGRPRSKLQDAREDRTLQAAGYTVLRFTDTEVYERPRRVLEALRAHRP